MSLFNNVRVGEYPDGCETCPMRVGMELAYDEITASLTHDVQLAQRLGRRAIIAMMPLFDDRLDRLYELMESRTNLTVRCPGPVIPTHEPGATFPVGCRSPLLRPS